MGEREHNEEPQGQMSYTESGDIREAIVHAVEGGANGWSYAEEEP